MQSLITKSNEAKERHDFDKVKSLLSRIVGEDGPFLVLELEYSQTRLGWELEAEEYMEQLKKEYPDSCLG